jgi:hypothetical protein
MSMQLSETIYVLGLSNFKELVLFKATNMNEDQHPAPVQIAIFNE